MWNGQVAHTDPVAKQTLTVGLLADPGLPEAVARSVAANVAHDLNKLSGSEPVEWAMDVSRETMPLTAQNEIPLLEHAPRLRREHDWDYVIYLTDLPRSLDENSIVCEVDIPGRSALISLPALGAVRVSSRTRKVLRELIRSMQQEISGHSSAVASNRGFGRRRWRRIQREDTSESYDVVLTGPFSRPRLLSGMVRSNRPVRLLPALSSCMATAVATGGFGIFYASIWNMSDALTTPRMAMISVFVVAAFSMWLIIHNSLWAPIRGAYDHTKTGLDNIATVITVGVGIALMYLVLWGILLAVTLAVVNAEYLASEVGHPVNLLDYLDIAWLASALGMMGGAMGSNFDSESAIREATYTRREHVRRQLAQVEEKQE